ncbi:unnamed protein product [Arctia plantaginis]|uniref:Uncharacterized protein n=1 Tax=Arctia plantaginis TaxID=874455 RepID=A0A8S1BTS8_ARCPL|nr:unnamed protein product [Arctia plantaginis]
MKIIGLSNLIRNEETEECKLQNCNLVVDAHSFFYNAYEKSKISYVFGCDAKEYAKYVRVKMLLKFKRANVKCYFIFKGGTSDIDEKINKTKSRKFDFESNHKFIPPIFMREVCQQMIEEAGFTYTTSITSNTDDCVALAEALECAILSNKFEYCFKKVPFIPTNTLRYSHYDNYIMAGQYKLQNFLKKHSLTERKFAIFITLSDLHVYEKKHFDDLLKTWNVSDENLDEQNKKLLKWLSDHTEEEALSGVSEFLGNDNKKFNDQMQNLLDKIHQSEWTIAADYLFNDCRLDVLTPDPWWFEKGVVSQSIAIPYIDLYNHKTISGSTAIEKKDSTDSIMAAINIIVYAYSLLTNFQQSEITIFQDSDNIIKINTKEFNVRKPGFICKESVFEKGWKVVRHLNLLEYFLRENKLNLNCKHEMPLESRVFLFSLAYFSRKKMAQKIDVTKEVNCFILYYSISNKLRIFELHKLNMRPALQVEAENLIELTDKYFKLEENEEEEIFDGGKLKTFVEIQYCLLHMNYLNTLCGENHYPTLYHRYINGPFVYKLLKAMENHNFYDFLESHFQLCPSVLSHVHLLLNCYNKILNTSTPVENWRIVRH